MLYIVMKKQIRLVLTICLLFAIGINLWVIPVQADESIAAQNVNTRMWDAIVMKDGCDYAYVRGGKQNIDKTGAVPYIKNNVALIPLRFIADSLNSRVEWNGTKAKATLYYMQYEYVFVPGSDQMTVIDPNGSKVMNTYAMSAPPELKNGKMYISLESFAKAINFFYAINDDGVIFLSHSDLFKVEKDESITVEQVKNAVLDMFKGDFNSETLETAFYVNSQNGRDGQSGTYTAPFRTFERAKEAVRNYIAEKGMNGNIIVYLRGGEYNLDKTLQFDEKDSGLNGYKVIYKAFTGEEPIVNGGQDVKGWEKYKDNVYRAYVGKGKVFHTLFENGTFAKKARFPNEGYKIAKSYNGKPDVLNFNFDAGDIPNDPDIKNAEFVVWPGGDYGHWNWFQDIHKFNRIDFDKKEASLTAGTRYTMGTGTRYFTQGTFGMLDTAGEFYLDDKEGYVYYWPLNANIEEQSITMPASEDLINIKGTSEEDYAHDISFEGVTFRNVDRAKYGFYMTNVARITIDACKIYNIGGTACFMEKFSQNNIVSNNEIYNIGQDGIRMNGSSIYNTQSTQEVLKNTSRYNVVVNNHMYNFGTIVGHTYPIIAYESGYNYFAYNNIHDSTRYAIMLMGVGNEINNNDFRNKYGTFDEMYYNGTIHEYLKTDYNVVEFNDVSNCYTDSQDVGALYGYGIDEYNIIRNNAVHDNNIPFSFCGLLYIDDFSFNVQVYNNILYNNQTDKNSKGIINSTILAKGVGNTIFNNISAGNGVSEYGVHANPSFIVTTAEVSFDKVVQRNIFTNVKNISQTLYNPEAKIKNRPDFNDLNDKYKAFDYNLYYNDHDKVSSTDFYSYATGKSNYMNLQEWTQFQDRKYDNNSIFNENPLFMNENEGDYRLSFKSPAYALGIKDINMRDIGLKAEFPYKDNDDVIDKVFVMEQDTNNNSFVRLSLGGKSKINVSARTKKGYQINMEKAKVSYEIDNPEIIQITDDGIVLAKKEGDSLIKVNVEMNGITKSTVMDVIVKNSDEIDNIELTTLNTRMTVGGKISTFVKGKTQVGNCVKDIDVKYISSNPDIAVVDEKGVVTAIREGKFTIIAIYNKNDKELKSSIEIFAQNNQFFDFDFKFSKNVISVGETAELTIISKDSDGKPYNYDDETIEFKQFNENLVTIDKVDNKNYIIKGLKGGMIDGKVSVSCNGITKEQMIGIISIDEKSLNKEWLTSNYLTSTGLGKVYNDGNFIINSKGVDIWGKADDFTYLYKNIKLTNKDEKVELYAKFLGWNKELASHLGIMFRDKNIPGSKNMAFRIMQSSGGIRLTWRNGENGESGFSSGVDIAFPCEVKIIKQGSEFKSYYKNINGEWEFLRSEKIEMGNDILAGFVCYSGSKDKDGQMIEANGIGKIEIRTGDNVIDPSIVYGKK